MRRGIRINRIDWSDDGSHIGPWTDGIVCDEGPRGGMFRDIIWIDGVWDDVVWDERVLSDQVG